MLDVKELTVRFGGLTAVNDASFTVGDNEVMSVIGPNGAGKTTLFNAISGFVPPTEGKVSFAGKGITRRKPHQIARLGLVRTFQKRSFFPGLTVRESVHIGLREAHGHGWVPHRQPTGGDLGVDDILATTSLDGRADEVAESLPYGEQRLLGVAIALTRQPKMLLLDEPCAGMNAVEVDRMIHLIGDLRQRGLAIVVVEHHMRFVMGISDHVIVLDHGVMLAEGSPQEVRENPDVIEAYLGKGILDHDDSS